MASASGVSAVPLSTCRWRKSIACNVTSCVSSTSAVRCWADRMSPTTLSLDLPADYRISDLSAFHRRDPQQIGERWTEHGAAGITLDKAFCLNGQRVRLSLQFVPGRVHATVDDIAPFQTVDRLTTLISRLLGLDQPVAEFAARFAAHPVLGPLLRERPGLRVPQTATPFEALTWAITGQQISVAAAVALRRKLILAAALPVGDLWAFPAARPGACWRWPRRCNRVRCPSMTGVIRARSRPCARGCWPCRASAHGRSITRCCAGMAGWMARCMAMRRGVGPCRPCWAVMARFPPRRWSAG